MNILIAGDYCPTARIANLIEDGHYGMIFDPIRSIIESSDYSIVNFECPVVIDKATPIDKCGPSLKCTIKGVEALKYAGFNMATLANNHFLDYGEIGVKDTLEACEKYGLDTVGGGDNLAEAQKIVYKNIGGELLAIINCCEHEYSIAEELSKGSNPLNPIQQYYQIQEAKKNADYVLVIVHGGHEYCQLPSPRMIENYRFFVDVGADSVVNHHQHCYSGYEIYNGKPIFYGLGNFCFDKNEKRKNTWNEGFMVQLTFSKEIIKSELFPYIQCDDRPNISLIVDRTVFDKRMTDLNMIISDHTLLKNEINKYYLSQYKYISLLFEPYNNRYAKALRYRNLLPSFLSTNKMLQMRNYIECESHRDKITAFLRNKK